MRCLPLFAYKSFYSNKRGFRWKDIKTGNFQSFNDQPSVVMDYGFSNPTKEWCSDNLVKRDYGKPCFVELTVNNPTYIYDMSWHHDGFKNIEEIHPDYRDDWARICTEVEEL